MAAAVEPLPHSPRPDTDALGRQITELGSYLYAATYRLLVLRSASSTSTVAGINRGYAPARTG